MTISCSSTASKPAAPENSDPPPKAELTQVTTSMFVDRSAVPNNSAMKFTPPEINDVEGAGDPVEPPECGPIYWGPTSTQAGTVSWSSADEGRFFFLFLSVPAERPDLRSLLGRCGSVKFQGVTTTAALLPLPGVPSWALATRIGTQGTGGAGIIGLCRGLYVSVAFAKKSAGDLSPSDTDALVKLFNDQVTKLEAI